ncbi:unnamed protein product [Natator depressus]
MRRGIGRMRPYPDPRGQRGGRGGPPFLPPLPMRGMMRDPFSLPPPSTWTSSSTITTRTNGLQRQATSPQSQRDAADAKRSFPSTKRLSQWTWCTIPSATWMGPEMAWTARWQTLLKRLILYIV